VSLILRVMTTCRCSRALCEFPDLPFHIMTQSSYKCTSQGCFECDDHDLQRVDLAPKTFSASLESHCPGGPSSKTFSSGKMIYRHMTRKQACRLVLHHAGGGFRLINSQTQTWSANRAEINYLARADSQHAVSHFCPGLSLARDFDQTFLLH
jgi:hypothetical protein